jgi:hypothetical protein
MSNDLDSRRAGTNFVSRQIGESISEERTHHHGVAMLYFTAMNSLNIHLRIAPPVVPPANYFRENRSIGRWRSLLADTLKQSTEHET